MKLQKAVLILFFLTLPFLVEALPRFQFSGEYLLWKIKDAPPPPIKINSGRIESGFIEHPGDKVVLGGHSIDTYWRSGAKFSLEGWSDSCFGAELSYFFLTHRSNSQSVHSSGVEGSPFLTLPYYDVTTRQRDYTDISYPGDYLPFGHCHLESQQLDARS